MFAAGCGGDRGRRYLDFRRKRRAVVGHVDYDQSRCLRRDRFLNLEILAGNPAPDRARRDAYSHYLGIGNVSSLYWSI